MSNIMKTQDEDTSLLSRQAQGGVVGGTGYNFQDAFIVSRIPDWLADPQFQMFLKEGAGDVDVKFGRNGSVERYYYQVKDKSVTLSEFKKIMTEFKKRDENSPNTYSRYILASRGLSNEIDSLRFAIEQYRGAEPMYNNSQDRVIQATLKDITSKANSLGLAVDLDFLINKVHFDTDMAGLKTDQRLCDQFVGAMLRLERWKTLPPLTLIAAYKELRILVNQSIRKTIERSFLEKMVEKAITEFQTASPNQGIMLRIYHWEDESFDIQLPWDILLDWSGYFNRQNRTVPTADLWQNKLLPQLEDAQHKVRSGSTTRLICFRGSACLSAGIALGWAFSEVKGYTFEVQQGNDIWRTDVQPASKRHLIVQQPTLLDESSRELCVEFSQQADVAPKVDQFIQQTGKSFRARLTLTPDLGIGARIDAPTALAYANYAKQHIRTTVDRFGCNVAHLFYAGPLGLAIFLGRLFNAMHADIQCYEEQQIGYARSCLLKGN